MRVLICGGRDWTDGDAIEQVMRRFDPTTTTLISGHAAGADRIAEITAHALGWQPTQVFRAAWSTHDRDGRTSVRCSCPEDALTCRAAGPRRNQRMINEGYPDMVIAFPGGKGTADMARRSRAANITTMVIPPTTT